MTIDTQHHWNHVYETKAVDEVSWYQSRPETSLALIADSQLPLDAPVIDVGGGASTLVDYLLAAGHTEVTVLDISAAGLANAQTRLGPAAASRVHWIEADVTRFKPRHEACYALWHDRAVFHFLTTAGERAAYLASVHRSVCPGGTVIVATFALDGPPRCSGLDVVRYDAAGLLAAFGDTFELLATTHEAHTTPAGGEQRFVYVRMRRR